MTSKKIAVVNYSGNVGKSTISRHLLAPNMPEASIVSVETINAGAASDVKIKGAAFGQLQEDMQLADSVIVDVGNSNIESFMALMEQYRGSHEDFDLYLVPTIKGEKPQKDTIGFIRKLSSFGVPSDKIRIIFNIVPFGDDWQKEVEEIFAPILAFVQHEQLAQASLKWTIWESELFAKLKNTKETVDQLADDPTDHKAAIAAATTTDEKLMHASRLTTKRLAQGVRENLREVFKLVTA